MKRSLLVFLVVLAISTRAFALSTVTKTVKSSGGDYTSLSAWEAGEQGDLPALDEIHVAECYNFEDTTIVFVNGWTTDATRYIEIRTPAGERHNGTPGTGYRLVVTGNAIRIYEDYIRVYGLEIEATVNSLYINSGGGGEIRFAYNLLHGGQAGIEAGAGGDGNYFYNNIIYNQASGIRSGGAKTVWIYNNTIVDVSYGMEMSGGTTNKIAINNLVDNPSITAFTGPYDAASDYNASSSGVATGGANDRINQTFTFANEASDDFHLASNDAGAKDYGVTDPGSGLFSDDIDGDTRSGSWDIGADEYVVVGVTIPLFYHHYKQMGN